MDRVLSDLDLTIPLVQFSGSTSRRLCFERCRLGPLPPPFDLRTGFGFRGLGAVAVAVELEDRGVMDESVDGRHGRHRVLEDLVPLAEDQVRGDDDRLLLVALSEEGEQDLHFLAGLLDVADIVEDDDVEAFEFGECGRQFQVAFGREQLRHQFERRGKHHLQLMSLDPLATEGGDQMRFAAPRQTEAQQIVAAANQVTGQQRGQLSSHFIRRLFLFDRVDGFARRQS